MIQDLVNIILGYAQENVLLSWIDQDKINWRHLSANPAAIELIKVCLEEDPDKNRLVAAAIRKSSDIHTKI